MTALHPHARSTPLRTTSVEAGSDCVCPVCRGGLDRRDDSWTCPACERTFPIVAGLPDLRLAPDRYLGLDDERSKARRLAAIEPSTDCRGLAAAYYAMTDDVDPGRRARYLAHIDRAEVRGEALAALLPRKGAILEIGCGTGGLLVAAARSGLSIVGADIATRWLVLARRRLADRGVEVPLVGASAEALPWPDASFDAVAADSLFEHIDDPGRAFRECARVLRPGGRLVAWSPNRFAITPDPHVGLWGVGWLPRTWAPHYVRARRGCAWTIGPLSGAEARRSATAAGFEIAAVEAPTIPAAWAEDRAGQIALGLYRWARKSRILGACGPLWQLVAIKGGA